MSDEGGDTKETRGAHEQLVLLNVLKVVTHGQHNVSGVVKVGLVHTAGHKSIYNGGWPMVVRGSVSAHGTHTLSVEQAYQSVPRC